MLWIGGGGGVDKKTKKTPKPHACAGADGDRVSVLPDAGPPYRAELHVHDAAAVPGFGRRQFGLLRPESSLCRTCATGQGSSFGRLSLQ